MNVNCCAEFIGQPNDLVAVWMTAFKTVFLEKKFYPDAWTIPYPFFHLRTAFVRKFRVNSDYTEHVVLAVNEKISFFIFDR